MYWFEMAWSTPFAQPEIVEAEIESILEYYFMGDDTTMIWGHLAAPEQISIVGTGTPPSMKEAFMTLHRSLRPGEQIMFAGMVSRGISRWPLDVYIVSSEGVAKVAGQMFFETIIKKCQYTIESLAHPGTVGP